MQTDNKLANQNRRGFILKAISSCTLCCLAGPKLIALDNDSNPIVSYDEHKFLKDSGLSIQEVYEFAFKEWYIPVMKNLKEQVGDDEFLEMDRSERGRYRLMGNPIAFFVPDLKEVRDET